MVNKEKIKGDKGWGEVKKQEGNKKKLRSK